MFLFIYFLPHGSENVFSALPVSVLPKRIDTRTVQKKTFSEPCSKKKNQLKITLSNYMQNKTNKIAMARIP